MRLKTKYHLLSLSYLCAGIFILFASLVLWRSINEIGILFLFIPFSALMLSLSIGLEMFLRTSEYDRQISIITTFLLSSNGASIGIYILLTSNDISQTIGGVSIICMTICFFIFLTKGQKNMFVFLLPLINRSKLDEE